MDMVTQVLILNKAVCISHSITIPGKSTNPVSLPPGIVDWVP